ncbi:MAG: phosphotransferase [Lachnospiraceae bacterium]|nr:phosphotransferase [Lachnospiraceae bacterium]
MNDRALKVLEQYELEVTGMRRGRGAWLLETPRGLRILSDYSGSENRALFQNYVMEKVRCGGYENVDMLLPNKEGSLVSMDWEGKGYVVKEWYTGRECDTSNEGEIFAAVQNLARLHRLMRISEKTDYREKYTAQEPLEELRSWNAQLRKIRSFIRTRHRKSAFEQLFLEYFELYHAQALEAVHKLAEFNDQLDTFYDDCDGAVCHGDYSHHHILMCGYEIATTNFDSCRFDFQINDLYRFSRKILEKHDWNARLGMRILETYSRVRPLSHIERRLLCVRMLYPEKFRKLAGCYYGSNKAWISRQYSDKLRKLNAQEKSRMEFIKILSK